MPGKEVSITIKLGVKGIEEKEKLIKNLEKLGSTASKTSKKSESSLKTITPTMQTLWKEADKLSRHWGISFQATLPYVKKLGQSFKFAASDTYKLAQAAETTSQKFNVSFKSTYATLKGMGVGLKGVSVDTDKTAKVARKFSQDWGVSFKKAFSYQLKLGTGVKKLADGIKGDTTKMRSSFNSLSKAQDTVAKRAANMAKEWGIPINKAIGYQKRLESETKKLGKTTATVARGIGYQLTFIAWHFRYLGNIFSRVGRQWFRIAKQSIEMAADLQESFLSISVAAATMGEDINRAEQFTRKLALTGLLPLTNAAETVKDLLIMGLGFPEYEKFAYRYLDVAFKMTGGSGDMAKSLDFMSKSIIRGTKVLGTDIAAVSLWNETNKRLNETLGLSLIDLSKRQRALEVLKTIETDYADTIGFHEIEQETLRATLNKLRTSIELLKRAYGEALAPVLGVIADALGKITVVVLDLMPKINTTVVLVTTLGIAITTLIGTVSFGLGVLISFYNIFKGLSTMLGVAVFSFWKVALVVLGIGTILTAGTYLILKYTGAWDKMTKSMENIKQRIAEIKSGFEGLAETEEAGIEIDEGRKLSHERAVEDIMEDLERERSKGLWANQMSIKDLKKRLKRENEDWDLYLKEKGKAEGKSGKKSKSILDNLLDDAMGTAEELGKIDWWEGLKKKTREVWAWLKTPGTWKEIGRKIGEWITSAFGKALGLIKKLQEIDWIGIGRNIANFFLSVDWLKVGEMIGSFMREGIKLQLMMLGGIMSGIMQGIWSGIEEPFKRIMERIRDRLNDFIFQYNIILGSKWFAPMIKQFGEFPWEKIMRGFPGVIPRAQFGGIVPGMRNQMVPIMAHGGERVIPAGEVRGGESIVVNINNPSVRNDRDITEIARQVSESLGQRNRFGRLGAF